MDFHAKRGLVIWASAALLGVLGAACGGSGDESASGAADLSRDGPGAPNACTAPTDAQATHDDAAVTKLVGATR